VAALLETTDTVAHQLPVLRAGKVTSILLALYVLVAVAARH
jgi:hypothetical protein